MLSSIISENNAGERILDLIDLVSIGIEVLAVVFIASAVLAFFLRYLYKSLKQIPEEQRYQEFRHGLARSLLLGLEMLIAADIARTVALKVSIDSILVLGLLVLIRTMLSWSLVVEIEGRWPWQAKLE